MLEYMLARDGGIGAQLRGALPADTLRIVGAASTLDWVPVDLDRPLHLAMTRVLGPEAHRELVRDSMTLHTKSPLVAGFLSGALRMFGAEPVRYLAAAAQLWPLLFRNTGTVDVTPHGARGVLVTMSAVCPAMAAFREYTTTHEGVFLGALSNLGRSARVRTIVQKQGREQGFYLEW